MWPVFIKLQPRYISGSTDHTQGSHEPPGVLEILSKLSLNKGQAAPRPVPFPSHSILPHPGLPRLIEKTRGETVSGNGHIPQLPRE